MSLCGLILMMAVIHHEDMPTNVLGIQGFNLWNVLFVAIFLAWLASRHREGLLWDMPRYVSVLLLMYLGVILVGFLRAVMDRSHIESYPFTDLVSEELINTIKWVLPGILLFDGCRTRRRVVMALVCVLAMYFLLSAQVVKRMPFEAALGGSDERIHRIRLKICRSIGYSSCDMSTALAGASWGALAALPLINRKRYRIAVLAAAGMIAFGQALTGGRAGYVAWGATGLLLCMIKWRKYLILAPAVVMLLPIMFPAVAERMLFGFGETDAAGQANVDDNQITSGRNLIWPHVIDKIGESPIVGHGRLATQRTGLMDFFGIEYDDPVPHPHNMYLETLLDNGILGSLPILLFWGTVVLYSARLFRSDDHLCSAVGGLALSLTMVQLIAGLGAQHFYPRESTFCVWAAMFLSLRVYVERTRVQMATIITEQPWNSPAPRPQAAITAAGV